LIAGGAVLLILVILCVLLVPPYAANWRLQNYVNDLADDPATAKRPAEAVRAQVLNEAAGLGLPVHGDDVQVGITDGAVKIDVLYIVHVDLAGYTVDLHFRPAAGS
jgi:type II secretory pathway component PulM